MYCTRCGTKLASVADRYCTVCGQPAPGRADAPQPGEVWKGELIARLRPPFEPLAHFGKYIATAAGALLTLFGASLLFHWTELTEIVFVILFLGGFVMLNRVVFLLYSVRVYENGLEQDIPRSWNKSVYLPWNRLAEHHWEGNILRYSRPANSFIVLRDGRWPSSYPVLFFPSALQVPAEQVQQIESLLTRTEPQ